MASSLPGVSGLPLNPAGLMRRLGSLMLASAALALLCGGGSAQEQVPASPGCRLDPLTLPLFGATPAAIIAATPPAGLAATGAGSPPDRSVIEPAIEDIVACINTGDPIFQYAIFTDRYLAVRLADRTSTYQPAFEQQLDQGVNPDAPEFAIKSIGDVMALDDGRISVVVSLSADGLQYEDRLILADIDGRWLIDDVERLDPATPTPGS